MKVDFSAHSAGVDEVLKLARSGTEESVVLAFVQSSTVAYQPAADEIIQLRQQGLSSRIIEAMLRRGAELRASPALAQNPSPASSSAEPGAAPAPVYSTPSDSPTVVYADAYPGYTYSYYYPYDYWPYYYPFYPGVVFFGGSHRHPHFAAGSHFRDARFSGPHIREGAPFVGGRAAGFTGVRVNGAHFGGRPAGASGGGLQRR